MGGGGGCGLKKPIHWECGGKKCPSLKRVFRRINSYFFPKNLFSSRAKLSFSRNRVCSKPFLNFVRSIVMRAREWSECVGASTKHESEHITPLLLPRFLISLVRKMILWENKSFPVNRPNKMLLWIHLALFPKMSMGLSSIWNSLPAISRSGMARLQATEVIWKKAARYFY